MEDKRMETKKEHLRLELDSLSQNEEFARVVTAVFMSRLNPTLEEIDDVKTAVSEAVTNSIVHGYNYEENGKIDIWVGLNVEKNAVYIKICDHGKGIPDVAKAMQPFFTSCLTDERSGMGFTVMQAFTDELNVKSELGKGTTVKMRKIIGACEEAENLESEANV